MSRNVPERIGPYEVRERIGEGGMATVYRAWHTALHRFEALKIPRAGFDEGEHLQRLLLEARTSARLHHPHIVAIHAVSEEGADPPFLAMDLVEGTTLEALLNTRGRLLPEEALGILEQVASALDYAHAQNVIHRDIKPGNILLQERAGEVPARKWNVKVVDFGISRAGEDDGGTRLTKSGMLVGTPEYMSPEQAGSGALVDFRTDLYALGVLAYEMMCGAPPFTAGDGVSRMSILVSHVTRPPRAAREVSPDISPATSSAIDRALSKNPDDRFPSGLSFVQAARASTSFDAPTATLFSHTAFDSPPSSSSGSPSTSEDSNAPTSTFSPPPGASKSPQSIGPRNRRTSTLLAGLAGIGVLAIAALSLATRPASEPTEPSVPVPASTSLPLSTSAPVSTSVPTKALTSAPASVSIAPTTARRRAVVRRAVPITPEIRRTPRLLRGQSRVVRQGRAGVREVTLEISTRAGRELSRRVLATREVTPPLSRIVELGTRVASPPRAAARAGGADRAVSTQRPARRVRRSRAVAEEPSVAARPRRARVVRRVRREAPVRRTRRASPARRSRVREAPLPP